MERMALMLAKDLKKAESASYGFPQGLTLIIDNKIVEWSMKNRRLVRYCYADGLTVRSITTITDFNYQGVFGKYMATEIVTKDDERLTSFAKVW